MTVHIYHGERVEIPPWAGSYWREAVREPLGPAMQIGPGDSVAPTITEKTYPIRRWRHGPEQWKIVLADDLLAKIFEYQERQISDAEAQVTDAEIGTALYRDRISQATFWQRLKYVFTKRL